VSSIVTSETSLDLLWNKLAHGVAMGELSDRSKVIVDSPKRENIEFLIAVGGSFLPIRF
jgi:hypothetical protein